MSSVIKIDARDHQITSVTVFRSAKAEVVRSFSVDLKEGQNEVVLSHLPTSIDSESVQVQGLGKATLFDVSTTFPDNNPWRLFGGKADTEKSDTLRELEAKKTSLEGDKRIRDLQAQIIVQYSSTLNAETISPVKMLDFMEDFYDQGQANLQHIAQIDKELLELEEKIKIENREGSTLNYKKNLGAKISLVLFAKEAGKIEFTISYLVQNASWSPVYDLRATTQAGVLSKSVTLHYRASIRQTTGEDWKNVKLSLSTSQSDRDSVLPAMTQLKLEARSIRGRGAHANARGSHRNDRYRSGKGFGDELPYDNVQYQQQQQQYRQLQAQQQLQQQQQQQKGFVKQANVAPAPLFQQPAVASSWSVPPGGGLFGSAAPMPAASTGFGAAPSTAFGAAAASASANTTAASAPAPPVGGDEFVVVPLATVSEEDGEHTDHIPAVGENAVQSLSESTAVATENSIAASYEVEGSSTIPSDNAPHRVALTVLNFEGNPRYIAVPKVKETCFLDCFIKNTSQHHILPGSVTIYMNDSYITRATLPFVAPQDKFVCCLGPDRSIRLHYSHETVKQPRNLSKFSAQEETNSHTITIKVTNKRQTALPHLVLRDMLPITDDDRIKIVLREPAGLVTAERQEEAVQVTDSVKVQWRKLVDGTSGEKQGWLEWICGSIPASGELEVQLKCDITAPADLTVVDPASYALFRSQSHAF